jgi:hypothetical protein
MSHSEFLGTAERVSGVRLTPAMPMRKAATSDAALFAFLEEAKPRHLHLLGIGIENQRAKRLIRAIQYVSPTTFISMDSNRLRAVVGHSRPLTRLETRLRSAPAECMYGAVESPILSLCGDVLDYTDLIASPSQWASLEELTAIAKALNMPSRARHAFLEAPDKFLQSPCTEFDVLTWIEHPLMSHELDRAWRWFVEHKLRSGVRSAAIVGTFRGSSISNQIDLAA